jgi:hypothetical protein
VDWIDLDQGKDKWGGGGSCEDGNEFLRIIFFAS